MDEQEEQELAPCNDCGGVVDETIGRSFTFAEDGLLCWKCAERRGGSFDENEDRWVTSPDLTGLPTATSPVKP